MFVERVYSAAGAAPPLRPPPPPRAPPPPRGRRADADAGAGAPVLAPAGAAAAAWAAPPSERHESQIRCDVVLNRPGNFTRVMTLLHRVQTDVCQTIRDGFLNVAIVVVFSPQ